MLVSISDSLALNSGFARVMRHLSRIMAQKHGENYIHIGYGAHYFGKDVRQITEFREHSKYMFGQDLLASLLESYPMEDFTVFTLLDAWSVGWLVDPGWSSANPRLSEVVKRRSGKLRWIGYFPIDGKVNEVGYPQVLKDIIFQADRRIYMSKFGKSVTGDRDGSVIYHGCFINNSELRGWDKDRRVEWLNHNATSSALKSGCEPIRFTKDDIIVLVVAANRRRKYWPTMLKAFDLLRRRCSAKLIGIYGGYGDWDLISLCNDLDLGVFGSSDDPCVWLVKSVNDNILEILYHACDVVWLISGGEGFGLPQLEAHGAGKPCIVGAYSASRELAVCPAEVVQPVGFWPEEPFGILRPIYRADDIAERTLDAIREFDEGARNIALDQAGYLSWDSIMKEWEGLL